MTDSTTTFDLSSFRQLPELERSLLQLLSVIYAPTAATPLAICARKVGIRNGDESFNLHSLKPILQGLMDTGWITTGINRFACRTDMREKVTVETINSDAFDNYSENILEAFEPRQVDGVVVWQDLEHGISHARIHLYRGDRVRLRETLHSIYQQFAETDTPIDAKGFYDPIFGTPPDMDIMGVLQPEILADAFKDLAYSGMQKLQNLQPLWELTQQSDDASDKHDGSRMLETRTLYCLLTGQLSLIDTSVTTDDNTGTPPPNHLLVASIKQLVQGNIDAAVGTLTAHSDTDTLATLLLDHELTALPLLAMINSAHIEHNQTAHLALSRLQHVSAHVLLQQYVESLATGVLTVAAPEAEGLNDQGQLDLVLMCLVHYWLGHQPESAMLDMLTQRYAKASEANYHWLAAEYAQALAYLGGADIKDDYAAIAEQAHRTLGTQTLFALVQPKAKWERALDALNMLAGHQVQTVRHSEERMIWLLETDTYDSYSLLPKLQKRKANGGWSKGRNLSLSRLKLEYTELNHLSEKDIELCNLIQHRSGYDFQSGSPPPCFIDMNAAWPILVNHPALYWDQSRFTALEVVQGEFELLVNEEGEKLRISFYPPVFASKISEQFVV
ncbi:MAG: hypothetical protein ACPG47_01795, partial [Leucothrix sp.]